MDKQWFLYLAQCKDGSIYTGITTNPRRREQQHNNGKGAKSIVKSKRPVKLVYLETHTNQTEALQREHAIKQWKRKYKLALIDSQNAKEFTL